MLESFKRFFAGQAPAPEWADVADWAGKRGLHFKRVHEGEGFVIDGRLDDRPWRMEWGPPQRAYIAGRELRIRMELKLPGDLQMLLLSKPLMDQLERQTYENFTEGLQTQIDTSSPEEMRWLVMFPKTSAQHLGRLKERYGAVCSIEAWMAQWLQSPLNDALAATSELAAPGDPVVLTIGRGRLMSRTAMPQPDARQLAQWFSVFEHALREARRLGIEWRDQAGGGLTTQPSAWAQSELPTSRLPDIGL